MRRLVAMLAVGAATLLAPAAAQAEFGLQTFDVTFTNEDGTPDTQAGSHPFAMDTYVEVTTNEEGKPTGQLKDDFFEQVPGFVGDATAMPRCSSADFTAPGTPTCATDTQVGIVAIKAGAGKGGWLPEPIYNLVPPPGVPARIAFRVIQTPLIIDVGVKHTEPFSVLGFQYDVPQTLTVFGARVQIWGNPADAAHDPFRHEPGTGIDPGPGQECGFFHVSGPVSGGVKEIGFEPISKGCPSSAQSPKPFITLPTSCDGPALSRYAVDAWEGPGAFLPDSIEPDLSDPTWASGSALTHDYAEPPAPRGFNGCGKLNFSPSITTQPTSKAASSPTGLDVSMVVSDEGLTNPKGLANSQIEKAVVTLPQGMAINPSFGEGLEVCTEADLARETLHSEPGAGCPDASKLGTVEVESPLVDETVKGSLFIAKPYENPFNSLLAMYVVLRNTNLGILVKQPAQLVPDPETGQLTTVVDDIVQLPFNRFRLHFREGTRSPLSSPPTCGQHTVKAVLYPRSGGEPVTASSSFETISGPNGAPCPPGGLPPFHPGLTAGTINNRAGSFSPFYLRLFRNDSEQEMTHFSIKLPPGVIGKIAGVPYCTEAEIEAAKARTGPHGGQEELDSPSCPAASQVGRALVGAGVGPSLTFAPGKIYLAGPYHGSNLSMVVIAAGIVGPFDIGTVVVRQAFRINPETAEVFLDSVGSDPIPHIVRGLPVRLRDIRVYVDRPEFVLNPTDCSPTSTASTVLGSGLDFVSEADDNPITIATRFQAADCAALTFAPQLSMRLIGGTKRGKFPKLVSHLQMNGIGEAGIAHAAVLLPHSEFIANEHFNNICTRVQFKEGAGNGANCPAGSIYGHARAVTPLLSEPLEGPVMLRSNPERQLPDVVAALHNSQVDFDLVGNVDSVKGQLRTTFAAAPDAPVTSFDLELEGGAKGLFVNSTNLCLKRHFAQVDFAGQNGKEFHAEPTMRVKCKGKAKKHKRHHRRGRR